jgi:hypothetical protein
VLNDAAQAIQFGLGGLPAVRGNRIVTAALVGI